MSRRPPAGRTAALALAGALLLPAVPTAAAATSTTAPATTAPSTAAPATTTPATTTPGTTTPGTTTPGTTAGRTGTGASALAEAGLEVTAIAPAELRPGGRVVVRGLVNGGADGLSGARIEVRRSRARISSVFALDRWTAAVEEGTSRATAGDRPEDPASAARTELVVGLGDVPAGTSVPFTATLDATEVGLRESAGAAGAYGLQLLLRDEGSDPVDDERGFLVWSPDIDVEPTRLSTTVQLQGPPPQVSTGLPDTTVLLDETAPGGRLDRVLTAAGALEADWVVDPVLLAALASLAERVPSAAPSTDPPASTEAAPGSDGTAGTDDAPATDGAPGAETPPGTDAASGADGLPSVPSVPSVPEPARPDDPDAGTEVAAAWLDTLTGARGDREVVLLDWADPDPARLRSADDPDDAWAAVRAAREVALPDELAARLLDGATSPDVMVATQPRTSARDLLTLAEGRPSVLLPEALVPLRDPFALTYTPDAVTEVAVGDQELTAVLDDASLSAAATRAVEGSPLALTQVLARLATTTLQRPNDARLLAVALPADLDPAPGGALHLADALAATGWAQPVPLSTAFRTSPSQAEREPLPDGQDRRVSGVQPLLDALADSRRVSTALSSTTEPLAGGAPLLRVAATLSRSAPQDAAAALTGQLQEQTSDTVAAVQVVPGSRVTLAAAEAELPVTVVNDLDTEVDLMLEVRSRSPRLQVPTTTVPVTVEPGQRAVVDVPVVAVASGPAEVSSQLRTVEGLAWGPPSTTTVTVATQAEGRVLTGVGIGVGVLFVLGAARAFARNRRGRELVGAGPVEP